MSNLILEYTTMLTNNFGIRRTNPTSLINRAELQHGTELENAEHLSDRALSYQPRGMFGLLATKL